MKPTDAIVEVRSRTDIVELIGGYVPLRRSGQGFKARCPFHEEKTASFNVSPARQTFYCFGCLEKGSVFDFVMKIERVEFREALELLADKAGVVLDRLVSGGSEGSQRPTLYRLHEWAAELFRAQLASPEGKACRSYVEGRALTAESQSLFGLGYAPKGWRGLAARGASAGYSVSLLESAGLIRPSSRGEGHYDMFRDRLVFPIRDAMGRVVAFGARSLDGSEPKYLNSPETDIFHKGRTLYGLELLRQHPRAEPVLVMEGYTDVIMAHQAGVRGAVATLGTALTPDHARLLGRYTDRVVLVYDGDRAGLAAAERGAFLLLEAGHLDIRVSVLPDGEDPFDFFRQRGVGGQDALMQGTTDLLTFLLNRSAARLDLTSLDGRRRAAAELVRAASSIEDPVARDLVLEQVADRLTVSVHALRDAVTARRGQAAEGRGRARPAPARAAAPSVREDPALRDLLQAVLNDPQLLPRLERRLPNGVGADTPAGRLLQAWIDLPESAAAAGELLDGVSDPDLRNLAKSLLLPDEHGRELAAQLEGARKKLEDRFTLELARKAARHVLGTGDSDSLRDVQRMFQSLKGRSQSPPSTETGAAG